MAHKWQKQSILHNTDIGNEMDILSEILNILEFRKYNLRLVMKLLGHYALRF